jgi:hypothetical protein
MCLSSLVSGQAFASWDLSCKYLWKKQAGGGVFEHTE